MARVEFDEIEENFINVWSGAYEHYFYKKSWEILTEQGLTEYEDEADYTKVALRIAALNLLFAEFSQAAYDEYVSVSEVIDILKNFEYDINNLEFIIGQMYCKFREDAMITDDISEAIYELVETEKHNVISSLRKGFKKYNLSVILYCVIEIDKFLNPEINIEDEDEDEDNNIKIEHESIDSYEDFWRMIEKHYRVIVNSDDEALERGYMWLSNGADSIAYYDC